ncbi:TonB-dependent receptor [Pseudenhygromyxa sp. WMMC2535]|nr:TonB-dependent receptor [Pseudenhygromyxa sp. WMMC2535]
MNGVVENSITGEPLEYALVILQCSCLDGPQERQTSATGVYSFTGLPPGSYTIQVLSGRADVSKIAQLPSGARFRANFSLDPKQSEITVLEVVVPLPMTTDGTTKLTGDEISKLPLGNSTGRDFSDVIEVAPTSGKDGAGFTLAGGTGAESKYTLENADITSPAFGTVAATLIQEFVQEVEIKESGYAAEFGGASSGQVSARRIAGTNTVRGEAGIRFAPRLAAPRLITGTDEALRVTQVGDFNAQAYAIVSGPIKKDKLFFTIGVTPSGTRYTLTQGFYSRVDRDSSGGYEDCPYENGANDCVDGGNYIDSERFADQRFHTGAFNFGYIAGLDWVVTPRHRLGLTAQGGPSFQRTSYRLPFSFDPNAFGTNPSADLGGSSRIATGVVNDHFGVSLAHTTLVALNYEGRVLQDKMEIDAGVSYFQSVSEDAWRLEHPELENIPATQEQDAQGRNLYEFLDRSSAVDLVPEVEDACNGSDLPGEACPTRFWLSGGLGEYDKDINRRVTGRLHLTHFFEAVGSHQIKWGGDVSWLQRHSTFTYSGQNDAEFYDNCDAGEEGGGEYCYNPATNEYRFTRSSRVNNHRFILVDTDNPNNRTTRGFGTIRREQGDLRALADSLGRGARVDSYDETLSTLNYALFLQDRWAILSNLYVSAGVRWELQDMRDIFGDTKIMIWDNIAPRLGVVYDWTDEGRSRLYASYGWFYQPLPLQLNSRVFGGLVNVARSYQQNDCLGRSTAAGDPLVDEGGQPSEWCVDTNASTTGLVEGAIVPRLKGQYNQQFQIGYEQEVIEDLVLGFRWLHTDLGRAVEDVSTNGGQNFIIANPGEAVRESDIQAQRDTCSALQTEYDSFSPNDDDRNVVARELNRCNFLVDAYEQINEQFDKPTRNYDAWTLQLQKRFAKNWLLMASYTYSRLIGNYDGFVDSTNGSINIGASTQYDIPELVRNSYGPLSGNIPHRLKIDGFYSFDFKQSGRLTLGTSFRLQSGVPVNVRSDTPNFNYSGAYLVYLLPRGEGGQVQPSYQWNVTAGYAYPLPGEHDLELEFNARVLNVTNAKAVLRVDDIYTYQAARPIAGGDTSDLKHAKVWEQGGGADNFFSRDIVQPQGNYGVETSFQQPLSAQFELKLRF